MNETSLTQATSPTGRGIILSLGGCLFWAALFLLVPVVYVVQKEWIVWPLGWIHTWRSALLAATLLLSIGSYLQTVRMEALTQSPAWCRWLPILRPLTLFPLVAVISLFADILPLGLVSNGLFFLPVVIVTMVLTRLWRAAPAASLEEEATTRRWAWRILGGTALFFMGIGIYVSVITGEHVGDEGHYLIQAESLFRDGDLDIKNNFSFSDRGTVFTAEELFNMHIAPNALGGHWYSWHPYGLSLLLAPFWPAGMPLRQLLLGLISGAGCVGLFLLSRRLGASSRSALIAILLFAGSVYWTIYSVRALPEVLGASLLIWVFWAMAAQKDKPWISIGVAAAGCVCLPFAHLRFLPLALMGIGLYGLAGLFSAGHWGRKVLRLMVFSLLCLAGAAVYVVIQRPMFSGILSYQVGDVFFNYPLGAWAILADARGVTAVLPLFMWLAAAWVAWVVVDGKTRWFALGIGVIFLSCLLTSASNTNYIGGSCIPGRFVVVVVPLLIPAAARMLDRASLLARGWFIFLGLVSIAVLIVTLVRLPVIGRDFVLPVQAISRHPLLLALYNPHSMFMWGIPLMSVVTSVYVAVGLVFTLVIVMAPADRKVLSLLAMAVILSTGVVTHRTLAKQAEPDDADIVASELLKLDLDRALVIRRQASRAVPLFEVSRHVFRDVRNPQRRPIVTTQDLGSRRVDQMLSQPRIEVNDWADRGFRWTTLTAPIDPPRGRKLIHVGGRIEGAATVVLAIREGGHTLFEGPLPAEKGQVGIDLDLSCRGKSGHLYILVRLENGEGIFYLDELYWSPYNDRILKAANLELPAGRVQGPNPESGRQTSK